MKFFVTFCLFFVVVRSSRRATALHKWNFSISYRSAVAWPRHSLIMQSQPTTPRTPSTRLSSIFQLRWENLESNARMWPLIVLFQLTQVTDMLKETTMDILLMDKKPQRLLQSRDIQPQLHIQLIQFTKMFTTTPTRRQTPPTSTTIIMRTRRTTLHSIRSHRACSLS